MCRYHVATRMPSQARWSYSLGGGAGGGAPPRLPASMVAGGQQMMAFGNTATYKCADAAHAVAGQRRAGRRAPHSPRALFAPPREHCPKLPSPRKVTLAWLAAEFAIDVWHSLTHGVLACGPQASALEPPAGVAAPARAPGIAAGRAHGKPPASRPSRRALRNSFACVSAPYPQHRLCVATPAPPAGCAASDGHAVDDGARHDSAHANAAQLWRDSSAEREWWWWWCCCCSRGLPTGFADKLDSRAVCLCDANPAQNLSNTDMGMLRNTALPPVRPFKGPAISEWQSAGVVGGTSGKVRFSTRSHALSVSFLPSTVRPEH